MPAQPAPAAPPEEWRPVPDNPNYEVSSHGRIRTIKTGQIKRQNHRRGRPYVDLYDPAGKLSRQLVSGLVAAAFLGPKPEGKQIEHLDQDKVNNHVSNLAYMTQSENIRRSYALTDRRKHNGVKLSPSTYEVIRELWATGQHSQTAIAAMLGISNSTVSLVVRGLQEACGSLELAAPDPALLERHRRKPTLDKDRVRELRRQGHTAKDVAMLLGCSVDYVHKLREG